MKYLKTRCREVGYAAVHCHMDYGMFYFNALAARAVQGVKKTMFLHVFIDVNRKLKRLEFIFNSVANKVKGNLNILVEQRMVEPGFYVWSLEAAETVKLMSSGFDVDGMFVGELEQIEDEDGESRFIMRLDAARPSEYRPAIELHADNFQEDAEVVGA